MVGPIENNGKRKKRSSSNGSKDHGGRQIGAEFGTRTGRHQRRRTTKTKTHSRRRRMRKQMGRPRKQLQLKTRQQLGDSGSSSSRRQLFRESPGNAEKVAAALRRGGARHVSQREEELEEFEEFEDGPYSSSSPGLQMILGPQIPEVLKERLKECLGDVIRGEEEI